MLEQLLLLQTPLADLPPSLTSLQQITILQQVTESFYATEIYLIVVELKSNFLGTSKVGETLECEATLAHGGKSTHVWDAVVKSTIHDHPGKTRTIALFRATELILIPKHK
jgi:acyl-coenzyme A thioesterase PaaI-like protein